VGWGFELVFAGFGVFVDLPAVVVDFVVGTYLMGGLRVHPRKGWGARLMGGLRAHPTGWLGACLLGGLGV